MSASAPERRNRKDQPLPQMPDRAGVEHGNHHPDGDNRAHYDSKHRDWHQANEENQAFGQYAEQQKCPKIWRSSQVGSFIMQDRSPRLD